MPTTKVKTPKQPTLTKAARTLSPAAPAGPVAKQATVKAPQASAPAPVSEFGVLEICDLDAIRISNANPRTVFDEQPLRELAMSIQEIGLLQPMLVGRCGEDIELIAGERRWRACKMAGLTQAPCYVRVMTREQITLARLAENLKREDLTAIDEALGYRHALNELGITQSELALRLKVSQGQVSNRMRLLTLPDEWQRKIISGEILPSQARDLVKWADHPAVLDALQEYFVRESEDLEVERFADLTAGQWETALNEAVDESTEPLSGYRRFDGDLRGNYDLTGVDAATLERLQLVEVTNGWQGKRQVCTNLELWKELVTEQLTKRAAAAKKKEQRQIDGPAKKAAKAEPKKLTADEIKQREEQHNKRLYRHRIACLQRMINAAADRMNDDQLTLFVLMLALNGDNGRGTRMHHLREAAASNGQKLPGTGHETAVIGALKRNKLRATLISFVQLWTTLEAKSWSTDADPELIEWLAQDLKIDFAKEWRVTDEFLGLHTIEQLGQLASEWKVISIGSTKADRIDAIVKHDRNHRLPAPKSLLSAKPCKLD